MNDAREIIQKLNLKNLKAFFINEYKFSRHNKTSMKAYYLEGSTPHVSPLKMAKAKLHKFCHYHWRNVHGMLHCPCLCNVLPAAPTSWVLPMSMEKPLSVLHVSIYLANMYSGIRVKRNPLHNLFEKGPILRNIL